MTIDLNTPPAKVHGMTGRRLLVAVLIGVVTMTLLWEFFATATGEQTDPHAEGSLNVSADGTRAYADLLTKYGNRITRQTGPITKTSFQPDQTVFRVGGAPLSLEENAALMRFVNDGGHLILTGETDLTNIRDDPPTLQSLSPMSASTEWTIDTPNDFNGARTLIAIQRTAWSNIGSSALRIGRNNSALLTTEHIGSGTIDFLADPSVLNNSNISAADNAAFALALANASDATKDVVFSEGFPGGTRGKGGWHAIPSRWKTATLLLFGAAALYAWSSGRRFGPADQMQRELAPARSVYLDAISLQLATRKDLEGARAHLAEHATRLVHSRALETVDVETLAAIYHCAPDDLRALFGAETTSRDYLGAARAFAAIRQRSQA